MRGALEKVALGGCGCSGGLNPHLDEEQRLQQEVEQHVSDDFADAGEGVRFPAGDFEGEICNVLMERGDPKSTGIMSPGIHPEPVFQAPT